MLTPDYIRGFVDGEGCFYILNTTRIACEFQVSQKDRAVLEEMRQYFGCGYIKMKYDAAQTSVYIVKSIKDLSTKIVPFFREHPLIVKRNQFERFAEVVQMQSQKLHLTPQGKLKIAQLKLGTSETKRQAPTQERVG
jgi:hypothetical protein